MSTTFRDNIDELNIQKKIILKRVNLFMNLSVLCDLIIYHWRFETEVYR